MNRIHIHFASAPIGTAVSGMRPESDLFFHLDIPTALAAGLKLYVSSNRILLTEGIDGMIPLKLFNRIERLDHGNIVDVPFDRNALPEERKPQQPKAERKWANAAAGISNAPAKTAASATSSVTPAKKPKASPSPSLGAIKSKLSANAPAWSPSGEAATGTDTIIVPISPIIAATPSPATTSVASITPSTSSSSAMAAKGGNKGAAKVAAHRSPSVAPTTTPVTAPTPIATPAAAATTTAAPLPFVVAGQRPLGPPKRPSKEAIPQASTSSGSAAKKPAGKIGVSAAGTAMITSASTPITNVNTDLCPFDYIAVLGKFGSCLARHQFLSLCS
jgi:hypothetical protein